MQYMLLIYTQNGDEPQGAAREAMYAEYGTLANELRENGKLLAGNELQPVSTATTVRVPDGETLVTDGPFAETKETLGGYFLVDCESLDEALEIAARIPGARHGSIEVRPVVQR